MGIAVMMFMMTMEVYPMSLVIFMLSLAYFYKQINESFPQKQNRSKQSSVVNEKK